jgi:SAM-dependent methyltransferase
LKCRFCSSTDLVKIFDLGLMPPSNDYLEDSIVAISSERKFPLEVYFCENCFLVQTKDFLSSAETFKEDYAYLSSMSKTWLDHSQVYANMIQQKLKLNNSNLVLEIASNDGYLLQYFNDLGIRTIGVEPTASTANVAKNKGIDTLIKFFNSEIIDEIENIYGKADLIVGNNVYAHVPDIRDFTSSVKRILNANGTITFEFPHLLNMIKNNQFDTIYHEHYSYLSLSFVVKIFEEYELDVYFVEKIPTHGGSLRIYGCHKNAIKKEGLAVEEILREEYEEGLTSKSRYIDFQIQSNALVEEFKNFIRIEGSKGLKIVGYGAAAKGNIFLNYSQIDYSKIDCIYDKSEFKIGRLIPGAHVKIKSPEELIKDKPDWIVIFPWNIAEEIVQEYKFVKDWGGKFITFSPQAKVYE